MLFSKLGGYGMKREYMQDGNLFVGENGEIFMLKDYQRIKDKDYRLQDVLTSPGKYPELDIPATTALSAEVPPRSVNLDRSGYVNELNNPLPVYKDTPDKVFFNEFPYISDDFISDFARQAGVRFYRKDVYNHAAYNPQSQEIEYTDEKGRPVDIPSSGLFADNEITIFNEIVSLSREDAALVRGLHQEILQSETANPELSYWDARDRVMKNKTDREQKLYKVYQRMLEKETAIKRTILHELKHFKNNLLLESRSYKESAKNLTLENIFNKDIDDERSATFEETLYALNTYLQQENYRNFSMFAENDRLLVSALKTKLAKPDISEQEKEQNIRSLATDYPKLMNLNYILWNNEAEDYRESLAGIALEDAEKQPLFKETEKNNEEYLQLRSIMFSYRVYNPESKSFTCLDLSRELKTLGKDGKQKLVNVRENPEILKNFINVSAFFRQEIADINKKMKTRKLRSQMYCRNIDKALIARARELSRKHFRQSAALSKHDYVKQHVYQNLIQKITPASERL